MGRGSVRRRGSGWCIRLDVGVDPETGKRRQVSRQGFRTKREAQAVLNDLLLEHAAVRRPDVSVFGPTVGGYLEEWLARARVSVRESTWAAYRNAVGHLIDGLGGGSVRLLSPLDWTWHDLRHTYATIALRAGVHPAIVSERFGHSSIAVTIDLYSHAVPGLQRDAAGVVGDLILAAAEPSVGDEGDDA